MNIKNDNKFSIYFFTFTTSMLWFSLYAYVAELSTYASTLGASYRLIGVITGSYGLTQLILRIPLGIFSDLISKRKIFIILGLGISILSSLITFIYPSTFSLLITRSLAGVSASTWVLFTVMFASYFKKEEATKAIGLMNSYNAIGQLSAMAIGGFISYKFGTRYLFLLAAIGAFIGLITSLFIHEAKAAIKKMHFRDFIKVAKNRQLQVVSILGILSQLITFATAFGFVPILAKKLGAQNFQLSILAALAILPAIFISRLAGSFFPDHIGRKNTINIGFILSALLCIVMPFINNLPLLYLAQVLGGVGRSMVFPLLMGLGIEQIDSSKRATAMGFFQAVYGIGMVFGPILLGFIAQSYGLIIGFLVTGLIGLTGLIITLIFIKDKNPNFNS
ncbi:MAG: MFS transporter [Spirochaetaceae bacterium]